MPQTLGFFLFSIGAPIGIVNAAVGLSLTGLLGFGLTVASIGLQLLNRPQQPKPEDVQQSLRQNTPPRMRYYGRNKHSGPWLFGSSKEGSFHKIIALAHGELDAIEEYWIDDKIVTVSAGIVTTAPYNSNAVIYSVLGSASQVAFGNAVANFTEFTTAHRGDGIAMLYAVQLPIEQEDYYETFPNGIQTLYRVVSRGSKVKNPHTGVVAWDDNAASVIRDYMTHSDGMRLPEEAFTTPLAQQGWEDAFDAAGELYALAAGGSEERYILWGGYSLQERPAEVLGRMLRCCDGKIIYTSDGGVTLDIGSNYEPTVVFDEDNILDISDVTRGVDTAQRPNTIKATYLDPSADYTTNDAQPWQDEDDAVLRGVESDDLSLPMSPSHSQTRRLMKLHFYRRNPEWSMTITVDKSGLSALSERFVRVRVGFLGIDAIFEVQNLSFNFGENSILEGATLSLISMPPEARNWTAAQEEGSAPVATIIPETSSIPTPTNVDATVERQDIGGTIVPFVRVDWDTAPSVALTPEVRYKKGIDTAWATLPAQSGVTDLLSPALEDNIEYDFEVRFKALSGRSGDWSTTISITPVADETAPGVVLSLVDTGGSGEVDLTWTSPNSANYSRSLVRRNTTNNEAGATLTTTIYGAANSPHAYTDTGLSAGSYYYWITAANASGVESASVATGEVTVS